MLEPLLKYRLIAIGVKSDNYKGKREERSNEIIIKMKQRRLRAIT